MVARLADALRHLEAIEPGEHHVEDHEVEAVARSVDEKAKRRETVADHLHGVALLFEVEADPLGQVLLVLDDEDPRLRRAHAATPLLGGRVRVNVEPRSGPALSPTTLPPCFLTTVCTMNRPSPVPVRRRLTSAPMR